MRWSPIAGQFGGLVKLGSGCCHAASFVAPSVQYASSGVRPARYWAKDGTRWTAALYGNSAVEQIGPIITAQFRRAGFSVSWNLPPDYVQPVYGGKADLALWGHGGGIFDPHDTMLLYHRKFYRAVGQVTTRFPRYRNKKFDELTDQVGT
jgi:peptide/nickel transport system substrate-binding protein